MGTWIHHRTCEGSFISKDSHKLSFSLTSFLETELHQMRISHFILEKFSHFLSQVSRKHSKAALLKGFPIWLLRNLAELYVNLYIESHHAQNLFSLNMSRTSQWSLILLWRNSAICSHKSLENWACTSQEISHFTLEKFSRTVSERVYWKSSCSK